ncbi:MAG: PAS domain S-box protein [Candidatus Eisenbacteria bacterium]|uniref:histidine kinase n=1 Tax=Eiseniibacteriota bacterium TaxID=2212470 RepID=A0A933WC65_UNCEI|nr:PAS domain S-box protein [Candidatus Eisenbacteria bacterium]
MSNDETRIRRKLPAWRLLAGPAATLAFSAVLHLLEVTPAALPNPGVLFSLAVVTSAYIGGVLPGLLSAAIGAAYVTWFHSQHVWPLAFDPEDFRRLPATYLTLPALAVLVGLLQARRNAALQQAALATAAARFQDIFQRAGDAIFVADPDGRYRNVNQRACELTGYSEAELLQMRMSDVLAPGELQRQPFRIAELNARGTMRTERRFRRKDGTLFMVEISASMTPEGRLLGIVRDVTAQHDAMEKLRRALSLQQATIESATDGILVVDTHGHWVGFNRRFLDMWRIPPELANAGDDARVLAHVRGMLEDPAGFLARIEELYAHPEASSFDELTFRDGHIFERYSLPQMLDGRPVGRVWSFRDVTEVRQQAAAMRDTDRRWQQTHKLEALGRLAGGVAHDFNNMLLAILGEAELLALALPPDSPHQESVANIRAAATRSAALTRQLLAFGRRQRLEPREVVVSSLLHDLEPLMRRIVGVRVHLALQLPARDEGPRVVADPGQIEQAVLNLVVNGSDAMPEGGELVVSVAQTELSASEATRRGARAPGPYAVIEVRDSGLGVPDDVRPHLFEPFFTTKEAGKGTGLGLATVYGAVEQAGGFIEVDSVLHQGATFRVLLPVAPAHPEGAPVEPRTAEEPAGKIEATLLVAEDEPLVRQFVCATLRRLGCDVLEAESGEQALAVARAFSGRIDLLMSDVIMPGMTGPELAEQLLQDRPDVRVLLMSGYPGDELPLPQRGEASFPLLAKPFGGDALEDKLRAMLA